MDIDGERKKISLQGIKRRWVYNYILIISSVLLLIEGAFIIFIKNYYYDSISQNLSNKVNTATDFYNKYLNNKLDTVGNIAEQLVKDFAHKEQLELQIIDIEGNIVMSSSGFVIYEKVTTGDYKSAIKGQSSNWTGINKETGEKIMSVSSPLKQGKNKVVGVVRYITSLEETDNVIKILIASSLIFIFIMLFLMLVLSMIFSKSIINPLNELNEVAKKMAQGQFSERVEKRYNDEIGELSDTLNYMAGEIVKTTQLKNEFISSISHELRTPLTSIKGWGETILTGGLEDKYEAEVGLKIIIKETTRLAQMVEELLDFSRIESGRIFLHLQQIDVVSELSDIVHITKLRGIKDGVILEYTHQEEIPEIMADQNRLKQVFINILDNAIKFTDSGKKVYVDIYSDEENVVIKIKDEGAGISEEDLPKVKEKFFKGQSKKSGSGIGLAVCDEIIKLHNGTLDIESTLNVGTVVTITLPLITES